MSHRQPLPKDDTPAAPAANYVSPLAVSSGQVNIIIIIIIIIVIIDHYY